MDRRKILIDAIRFLGVGALSGFMPSMASANNQIERSPRELWKQELLRGFSAVGSSRHDADLWRKHMTEAYSRVRPEQVRAWMETDVINRIDFSTIQAPRVIRLSPKIVTNVREASLLKPRLMLVPKGLANVPHAHNQMVSIHYVLRGRAKLFTFERDYAREVPGKSLMLTTASNLEIREGDFVLMTPTSMNVHWFAARSDLVTLNFPMGGIGPPSPSQPTAVFSDHALIYVDPTAALRSDRATPAPIIAEHESYSRFLRRSLKYFA